MCNDFITSINSRAHQRGISLILVLFLLVVVSLLAAAMAHLNRGGSNAVSMEIQSTRALFAAESGAQMAAMRLFPINNPPTVCPADFSQDFATGGLNNCSTNIHCNSITTAGRTLYTVTSEGVCGSGDDRARRRITIGLRSL